MTERSSSGTSEIARQCVAAGASARARRPALQRESAFDRVRRHDVEAGSEQQLQEREVGLVHSAQRRSDQARSAARDQNHGDLVAPTPGGDVADLCAGSE